MSTKELVKSLLDANPGASNSEIARLAKEAGASTSDRQLRKVAASYRDGGSGKTYVDPRSVKSTPTTDNRISKTVTDGETDISYTGSTSITSLDEAVEFFEVDLDVYTVTSYTVNSWDAGDKTNYQVKLKLAPINPEEDPVAIEELMDAYKASVRKVKRRKVKGNTGTGVAVLSDFHIGAKVTDMMNTDDFSYDVVVDRLKQAADQINRQGYKKVEVALLGDFIETFTGLNHMNSWQQLEYGGYGANVTIIAYNIIRDFLAQIDNLHNVTVVSGNHDRVTVKADVDSHGGVAQLLAFMLEQSGLKVDFNHALVSKNIDGIRYIFTHNHLGLSKNDMVQTFWEYGEQNVYNVLLGGHFHSRRGKTQYKKLDNIHWDQANYRSISVAPIFTGNWYSESNGWSSTSGITILENNGDGRPNVFDFTLV
jgi:predicted phosphodiesterase